MTKNETIQVLQSIEDRAVDFPNMTACDWVAIASAKRHLTNSIEVKEMGLDAAVERYVEQHKSELNGYFDIRRIAKHFYVLGLNAQKGE